MTRPLSVYVHIPFCTVKCGYCDFNAYAGMDALKDDYAAAIVSEMALWRPTLRGRTIASVAFGGGTPGEMRPASIAGILEGLAREADIPADIEVSIEANPGTTSLEDLRELRAAGLTRVSFGAQSFSADELAFLDRIHSPEATVTSVANARRAGFESIGLDLIYGIPGQTSASWAETLQRALALETPHLSTYALTVEENTPLAMRVESGEVVPPDTDEVADMYEAATEAIEAAGLRQYEISNWAVPGYESRHNSVYWTDGDYLGLGAGAHGYIGGERFENIAHPRLYIGGLQAGNVHDIAAVLAGRYRPRPVDAVSDWVSLRLRLLAGFTRAEFRDRFGSEIDDLLADPLAACVAAGILADDGERLHITRAGRLLHGEVAVRVLVHLEAHEADVEAALARSETRP